MGNLNGYVPLVILIPNFMASLLFVISCISSVDSSPNLSFFSHPIFCRRNLASHKKFYAKPHLPRKFPYEVERRYHMTGNRYTVNQSDS